VIPWIAGSLNCSWLLPVMSGNEDIRKCEVLGIRFDSFSLAGAKDEQVDRTAERAKVLVARRECSKTRYHLRYQGRIAPDSRLRERDIILQHLESKLRTSNQPPGK
jgi:hypothetical protein